MNFVSQLSLFSWNVRGMGDSTKCALIKDSIRNANANVICLQETKWDEFEDFRIKSVATNRYQGHVALNANNTRGGILILWDK
jgi:exonuclease III